MAAHPYKAGNEIKSQRHQFPLKSPQFLVSPPSPKNKNFPQMARQLREEAAEREAEAESTFEAQKEALSTVVEELLDLAFDSRRWFAAMQETLVNHKREVQSSLFSLSISALFLIIVLQKRPWHTSDPSMSCSRGTVVYSLTLP